MLNKVPELHMAKGETKIISIDLTEFPLQGGTVVFAIKEKGTDKIIFQKEFDEEIEYSVGFPDEFTKKLNLKKEYYYDMFWHIRGERFRQTEMTPIRLVDTVGGYVTHG